MEKSKRQALKEIKKRKLKDIAKTAAKKLAAVWVISSMLVVNVPTGFTMAAFVDRENSKVNSISAGTLNASLSGYGGDFSPEIKPLINATRDIEVQSLGTLGFEYNIKSGNLSGDLCSNLNLKADLDGINQYDGPIEDFNSDIGEYATSEIWHFEASLETDNYALQGKSCTLDFLLIAKQKDLISGVGYSDEESIVNIINAGTWTIKGVWIQTTVDDFNAGVSSLYNGVKEILVTPATDGTGDAQIATGGVIPPATITSAFDGDGSHLPPNAIDNNDSTFWKGTNSHFSWLKIDLGQNYPIEKIRILVDKLKDGFSIDISKTGEFTGEQINVGAQTASLSGEKIYNLTSPIEGRYVRLYINPMNGNPWVYEFQVLKRELPAFDGKATLTSQTFNSDKITKWVRLEWDETLLTGTDINFSIQTSNDGTNWSPWQLKAGTSPIDLSSLPQTRYIRWETELTTNTLTPPITTPVLHEARVYYEQENAQFNLVMNEILPNPEGTYNTTTDFGQDTDLKPLGEWIEIYNNSAATIDVVGFSFKNSTDGLRTINAVRTNTGSTVIGPGEWLVFYTGQEASPEFINNAGDTLTFYDLWGNTIDAYTFGPTEGNKSLARIPDGTGSWVDPIPTPGTANIQEESFLEELIQTVETALTIVPEILGETTTTPETTSTEPTPEPAAQEEPAETPIQEEPATTQEEQTTTQESPAPEEPADIPEEQPAIAPEAPAPEAPAPEAPAESPAPESAPAETAPETNSSTN